MAAANLTGDRLAFTGDAKRNAKWAQGPKAFAFKNKIRESLLNVFLRVSI